MKKKIIMDWIGICDCQFVDNVDLAFQFHKDEQNSNYSKLQIKKFPSRIQEQSDQQPTF
jgi:hypothetical protein